MFGLEDGGDKMTAGDVEKLAQIHFANELSGFIITVAAIYAGMLVNIINCNLVAFFTNP